MSDQTRAPTCQGTVQKPFSRTGHALTDAGPQSARRKEAPLKLRCRVATIKRMTIQRLENVGIVVDDLAAATTFFVELGLKVLGEGPVEGGWVDRVVGLEGVRVDVAMLETSDGHGRLELMKFHARRLGTATGTRRRTP